MNEPKAGTGPTTVARRPRGTTRRGSAIGIVLVAMLAIAGACGQKGGNDTSPAQQPSTTTTSARNGDTSATSKPNAASSATASSARQTTSSSARSTSTSSGGSSTATSAVPKPSDPQYGAFCQSFADFVNGLNSTPIESPDFFTQLISAYRTTFPALVAAAPSAIKADMETVNTAIQGATDEQFVELDANPEFKKATDNVSAWLLSNCGFKPS